VTQTFRPQFTAQSIFEITDQGALAIVREVGFANLAMGALGLASLFKPGWVVPAAIVGGLYYGLAGLGHLMRKTRNFKEQTALVSDLAIFVLLAAFVASRAL
jgi:NhaP-type Na+/H+ or K+/H+ antiporter